MDQGVAVFEEHITTWRRDDGWTFHQVTCNEHTAPDGKGCGGLHVFISPPPGGALMPPRPARYYRCPIPKQAALQECFDRMDRLKGTD